MSHKAPTPPVGVEKPQTPPPPPPKDYDLWVHALRESGRENDTLKKRIARLRTALNRIIYASGVENMLGIADKALREDDQV